MPAAVTYECSNTTVGASKEVVIIAGDDERRAVRELKPIAFSCRGNLRQNAPLEVGQFHPRGAVVPRAICKGRPKPPRASSDCRGIVRSRIHGNVRRDGKECETARRVTQPPATWEFEVPESS